MNCISKKQAYICLLLTFVLWGSLYVASQVVVREFPTFTVCFIRFLLAWLFLTFLSHVKRNSDKPVFHPDRTCQKYIWILGFFGYTISVGMQLMGTKLAGSTTASLINSINPVVITLLAALILKEKLTPNKIAGILLAVLGVYLIIGSDIHMEPIGTMLSIAAVIGWSLTSVISRTALSKYDSLQITRHAIGIAVLCNFPICLIELILTGMPASPSLASVICLLYMGSCCTGLTYILWNNSLAVLPASTCSSFYPIQPLTSALLGVVLFQEKLTAAFLTGALFIVVGVLTSLMNVKLHR